AAYPELNRRQLTLAPADAYYRKEWMRYYQETLNNKPPAPAVVPEPYLPNTLPAAPAKPVTSCPPKPIKTVINDCHDIQNHLKEGDIVLKSTPGNDSDFIRKAAKCAYSHAGIVTQNDHGDLVIVDAYPQRSNGAIAEESIDSFFCNHDTFKGLVTRPNDCNAAKKAAQWAYKQTKNPDYNFDIFNPWSEDPKRLYCSDFVYQSYQNAGIELVADKMDFLSNENKANTLEAVREYVSDEHKLVAKASDEKIEEELHKRASSSEYITPCQVAINDKTNTVIEFESSSRSSTNDDSKKTK
ncbi:MAG: YiiX/YebB-like N1pC/P60 family cysteine hydrolase, partial [Pseudomonadota bacterium]|nr:YiiX/YebB-like N1pC/P60 family cysteine hydrolase [Pseudomonadota bacterium]